MFNRSLCITFIMHFITYYCTKLQQLHSNKYQHVQHVCSRARFFIGINLLHVCILERVFGMCICHLNERHAPGMRIALQHRVYLITWCKAAPNLPRWRFPEQVQHQCCGGLGRGLLRLGCQAAAHPCSCQVALLSRGAP